MYNVFKFIHIVGVIILIGNVTISAFWKVLADRTRNPAVMSHAQHGVLVADWIFTLAGITFGLIGGYGAAAIGHLGVLELNWLIAGQFLFALSGSIWLFVLVPLQIKQARAARRFGAGKRIEDSYWKDGRSWLIWGIIATIPLVAAVGIMIIKPV